MFTGYSISNAQTNLSSPSASNSSAATERSNDINENTLSCSQPFNQTPASDDEVNSCKGVRLALYNNCNVPLMVENGKSLAEASYNFRLKNSQSFFFEVKTSQQPIKLHYRKYARPQPDSAVVFLPGSRAPEVKHTQIIENLFADQPQTDFFVVEHRGHGRSQGTTSEPLIHVDSYNDFIEDIVQFFDTQIPEGKYKSITITGHSTSNLMIIAALMKHPRLQSKISKVILTAPSIEMAPDLIGKIDNFGRIPIALGGFLVRQLEGLKLLKPDKLAPGYKSQYQKQDPNKIPPMVKNYEFYYRYHRYVELEDSETASPYPAFVEKLGPTNQWVVEMGRASQYVRNSKDIENISIPVVMITANQDYLVKNSSAQKLCVKLKTCKVETVDGFHDFIFDPLEISQKFFDELKNPK